MIHHPRDVNTNFFKAVGGREETLLEWKVYCHGKLMCRVERTGLAEDDKAGTNVSGGSSTTKTGSDVDHLVLPSEFDSLVGD